MKKNHITKMLAIILLLAPCLFLNAQEIAGTIVEQNEVQLIAVAIFEKQPATEPSLILRDFLAQLKEFINHKNS